MPDYNDFKEAFKSTLNGVADFARDVAVGAGDKAKAIGRIAKLTIEINAEKENAKKALYEIGKLYYETNRGDPGDFFVQLFDEVTLANEHISRMEDDLAALKASVGEPFTGGSDSFEDVVEAEEAGADASAGVEVEIVEEPAGDAAPAEEKPWDTAPGEEKIRADVPPEDEAPKDE